MWLNSFKGREIWPEYSGITSFPKNLFLGSGDRMEALKQALEKAGRTKYANNTLNSSGSGPKAKATGF